MEIIFDRIFDRRGKLIFIDIYLTKSKSSQTVLLKRELEPTVYKIVELEHYAAEVAKIVGCTITREDTSLN